MRTPSWKAGSRAASIVLAVLALAGRAAYGQYVECVEVPRIAQTPQATIPPARTQPAPPAQMPGFAAPGVAPSGAMPGPAAPEGGAPSGAMPDLSSVGAGAGTSPLAAFG